MPTLRDIFHTIANWHNKITVAAGCTKEFLKSDPLDTLSIEDLKIQQQKLVELLDKIESDAVNANLKVMELKEFIYKISDPSKEIA